MKYKPQKIEFNTPTRLTNVADKNYTYCTSDTALIPTLTCLIVPNKENMDKLNIIINSHSKEEQIQLILDT
ncbi:hypothetical protein ACTFIR_005745 [Dictyostelium discoideum]